MAETKNNKKQQISYTLESASQTRFPVVYSEGVWHNMPKDKWLYQMLGDEYPYYQSDLNENLMMGITRIPWKELLAMRNDGIMCPGMLYRITDYGTKFNPDLKDVDSAVHQFDVVVLALSKSELDENALACVHAGDSYFNKSNLLAWKLKYCLDNDLSRFPWCNSGGTGVIYHMVDEFNNEAPYDFKNARFARYAKNGPIIDGSAYAENVLGASHQFAENLDVFSGLLEHIGVDYKFTDIVKASDISGLLDYYGVSYNPDDDYVAALYYNDKPVVVYPTVLKKSMHYTFDEGGTDMSINEDVHDNRIVSDNPKDALSDNIVLFGKNWGNLIHVNKYRKRGKSFRDCHNVSIGKNCDNFFIEDVENIEIGGGCSGFFLEKASNVSVGFNCKNWMCEDCDEWSCGNNCNDWSCRDNCNNWSCGNNCSEWSCGKGCTNWSCGNSCWHWSCGNNCWNWSCGNSCGFWVVPDCNQYWTCENGSASWRQLTVGDEASPVKYFHVVEGTNHYHFNINQGLGYVTYVGRDSNGVGKTFNPFDLVP